MIKYINISFKEYCDLSEEERKEKPYCVEYSYGKKGWFLNKHLHRVDGPALINDENGFEAWYINEKHHREDGPAMILSNGEKCWYLNGIKYSFEEWLKLAPISDEEKVFLRLKYEN